ncbi:MAG TPA: hypothetical protein VFZ95_11830 [Steroidobacteraceae bacterium]
MRPLSVLPALLLMGGVTLGQQSAPGPAAQPTTPQPRRRLPLMAEEARARGYELPLTYGGGLILTYLDGREIEVTDVRVGLDGSQNSVSDYATLGSNSTVFNANFRFDTWILPFMNVYAMVGYVHNDSATRIHVRIPRPGPIPGDMEFDTQVDTSLDGTVGGVGMTLAGGYKSWFVVADFNYNRAELGFDDRFTATIGSVRTGWQGKIHGRGLQTWVGVGNWDTAATAKGHVDLDDGRRLTFEADQRPATNWMYEIGVNFMPTPHWQLFADFGSDFEGGYFAVLGPTYRF